MSFFAILFSFKGRVNRAKFWMVNLLMIVAAVVIIVIMGIVEFIFSGASEAGSVILFPLVLGWFWVGFAVTAKRWHDRNKSARWILIALIPIIGDIWAFVELGFCKGTEGPNRFGPDPLKKQ